MEREKEVREASKKVYEIENLLIENKKVMLDELPQLPNKTLINARHTKTGMTAVAYKDNVSNEIIIAYCGTNLSGDFIPDIFTDVSIVQGVIQIQVGDAVDFYRDVKNENLNSDIILTGHSLGGGLANEVNVLSGGEHKSVTFNPAPLSNTTRKLAESINVQNFTNYNMRQDPITIAGAMLNILGVAYPNGLITVADGGHDLDGFSKIDAQAEFRKYDYIEKANAFIGQVAHSNQAVLETDMIEVDMNKDGVIDKVLSVQGLRTYRNLLTGNEMHGGANEVLITSDVLFHFSSVLKNIANVEIPQLLEHIEVMIDINETVGNHYLNRVLVGTENIDRLLQTEGITKIVQHAVKGYEDLIDCKSSIQVASNFLNTSWYKKFARSFYHGGSDFAQATKLLVYEMAELHRDLTEYTYETHASANGSFYGMYTTQTIKKEPIGLLKDLKNILNKMDEIVAREFKGEGNRARFQDGLQGALKETLEIQKTNLQTVKHAVTNAAMMTELIGKHFENCDQAISEAIKKGTIQPTVNQITSIPSTFNRYLQENDVLDDVRDIISAWNKQVERAAVNIENNIFSSIIDVIQNHKSRHDAIYDSVVRGYTYTNSLMSQMENQIYREVVKTDLEITGSNYAKIVETGVIKKDEGTIRNNIGDAYSTILRLKNVFRNAESELLALSGSMANVQSALSGANSNLDEAIRDQIYKTAQLDEIVHIQKMDRKVTQTMIGEFNDAISSIRTTQKGSAIDTLVDELDSVKKLLEYFTMLSQECFGE